MEDVYLVWLINLLGVHITERPKGWKVHRACGGWRLEAFFHEHLSFGGISVWQGMIARPLGFALMLQHGVSYSQWKWICKFIMAWSLSYSDSFTFNKKHRRIKISKNQDVVLPSWLADATTVLRLPRHWSQTPMVPACIKTSRTQADWINSPSPYLISYKHPNLLPKYLLQPCADSFPTGRFDS